MEFILWTIIIGLFILSMVGLFVPVIPAVAVIWIGFFIYHFFLDGSELSALFWIAMTVFTILLIGADLLTNRYFVSKFGGSKASEWGAIIGVIIGVFVYPPFGIIFVPFIVVFLIEIAGQKSIKEASFASLGALAGFLSGVVAKFLIQAIMIVWFFLAVLLF